MTTIQPSAETTAFLEYLRESRSARGLAEAIVDLMTRRGHPVLVPVRVDRATRRAS